MKQLILGGARSGKSSYAEAQCQQRSEDKGRQKVYLATGAAGDDEMAQRIQQHQQQRDQSWALIEEPCKLSQVLDNSTDQQCLLIDCLTLWLSNCLHQQNWPEQREHFLHSLQTCQADVIMVSNEVGSGIVPMGELSRQFVDESGFLHQTLAQHCDSVTLVVAGLPMQLK